MDTPSALPGVMQQRMSQMRAAEDAANPPTPPANPSSLPPAPRAATPPEATPPATPPGTPPADTGERVTISRAEFNELRAGADKTATVTGREQLLQMAFEEAQERLTQLEAQVKSNPSPPAAPASPAASAAPVIDTSGITITDDEREKFGETEEYINKLIDKRIGAVLNPLTAELRTAIQQAQEQAGSAVSSVNQHATKSFQTQLTEKVTNLQELIKHKHWDDFLQAREPLTGATYGQLLSHNITKQLLDPLVNVYKTFEAKYVTPINTSGDGYQGANPIGNASQLPPDPGAAVKLKMSDRTKASQDYKFKKITYEQLQEISMAFDEAAKTGNIDYNA